MWGQLIIALACALEILSQDCVVPSGSQFSRASYLPFHGKTASGKTNYDAGETLSGELWIRVVCNKDRRGEAVLNVSDHLCSKGNWSPALPVCQDCGAPPKVENATASERITPNITFPHQTVVYYNCNAGFDTGGTTSNVTCVDGEWTSADIICATTTKAETTTTLTTTTTSTTTTSPINTTTSTTTGTPTTTNTPTTTSTPTKTTRTRPTTPTTATATTTHKATSEQNENAEITTKKIGCKIPANLQQGMTIFDPQERRTISAANLYEIQHGQNLTFTCAPSDVFYFEPNRRMFECVKGSWVARQRGEDTWDLGNKGSFPECRKVICPADYCKFGGHCDRDNECKCPKQTRGKQCETPLCRPGCQNGGTCVSPDTCQCTDGFDGLRCENDIDECSKSDKNDCHFSNCTNTPGSYTCKCIDGYDDLDDTRGRQCKALCIPECQNGGTCVSPYRCQCPDGFYGPSCENETKNCTLEVGQNVYFWHMLNYTNLSEGDKVSNGTKLRVTCQSTGFDYSDYYNNDISTFYIECVNGVFTHHELKCELDTTSSRESSHLTKNCTTIKNGNITDRGKSFTCNADYQPSFKNGMDAILYARYSCTCNKTTGRLQCMGTEVECKPIGCKIPANVQQGMTLFDPKERRTISAANRYEIQHGQFLTFTCEPSDVFYFEPNRRIFECVKGLWVSKTRPHVDTWEFGNNGLFPECRKVVCPADYCKFGGHCIRDQECHCPEQTSGKQCETPLCSSECQNNGTCVSPDTCKCPDGFDGLRCEKDIDECSKRDQNDCHYNSNCTNTPGSYTCKCLDGYDDLDGNRGRKCEALCGTGITRLTCDAPYCFDRANEKRVCNKGIFDDYICHKGLRECSTDEYLVNKDSTLSVSSQWDHTTGADQGRLYSTETGKGTSFRAGIWAASDADTNQYIQVTFTVPKIITDIATRGRPKSQNQGIPQWVKEYLFMYSTDCVTFNTYTHWNGSDMLFDANEDGNNIRLNQLPCPVRALCARVNPTKWDGHISMQFDVRGCGEPNCLKELRECSTDEYLVKNDSTLSVSSKWNNNPKMYGADQGRLNSTETEEGTSFRAGIWVAGVADTNQYIQVTFTVPKMITAIATRGRPISRKQRNPQWVTQYRFVYSTDCVTFNNYAHTNGSVMLFDANKDGDTIRLNKLPCPVRALCARVNPTQWYGHISMRFDVRGCD